MMNENRLEQLLNFRTFYNWYIDNQDVCLPQFRGFHLRDNQQIAANELSIQFEIVFIEIIPLYKFYI